MTGKGAAAGFRPFRHGMLTSLLLTLSGVCIEVLVVATGYILVEGWQEGRWLSQSVWMNTDRYHFAHEVNSVVGMFGSLLLIYGVLSFAHGLRVSRAALKWVYVSCVFLILLKSVDVLNTVFMEFANVFFDTGTVTDAFLLNMLIVGGCVSVLIGFMRALYDANRLNVDLEKHNLLLDREIGERRQAEERTLAREGQFSTILNALSSPVFLVDQEGRVLAHNDMFAQLWGRGGEDLVGLHMSALVPEKIFADGKERAGSVFAGRSGYNFAFVFGGRTYDVKLFPVKDQIGAVPALTVLALDITDKLRDEEERRLLEAAINNAAESIIITDAQERIVYVNPAFEAQTGRPRMAVMGSVPAFLAGGDSPRELRGEIRVCLEKGDIWRGRFVEYGKDGSAIHQSVTVSPIRDDEGVITHFVIVGRDITRELQLEQHLQRAQKLEALGTMAGGIAHDMKNVFAIVLGRSELAIPTLEAGHPARETFETIMHTVTRSTKMMKRLLTFARMNPGEAGPLYIASMINEQVKFMHTYLPSNVEVIPQVDIVDEVIIAEPSEVQQIFVNLVNNANAAMQPAGGTLEVLLEEVCLNTEMLVTTGILPPGNYVRLRVGDSGCGMDLDTQHCMFDPFFTTKAPGEGTGLGLPMIHGSVLNAGGQIHVESAPGKGTTIDIFWPQAAPGTVVGEESRHEAASGEGISVMVIDDMTDFKELLALNLKSHGFIVDAFEDASEALARFAENPSATDIAVVDFMMPGMNGEELARAMHELRPELPVILLSGYASGITNENAREHGFCAMFEKPVEMSKLSRLLVQLVPGSRAGMAGLL